MRHLDTSIVVNHLRGDDRIGEQIQSCLPDLAISAIVLAELEFGVRASAHPAASLARLAEFLELVPVLSFDSASAACYGEIRHRLRVAGRPIGETDTFIAAVALANQATLVTRNRRHFEQIEGLDIEIW